VTTGFTVKQTGTSKWMATVRPRIGYSHGHILYYITGGLAMADLNYQAVFTDTFAAATEHGGITQNKIGWTGGGGAEYSLGRHWSVRGEYLYATFGHETVFSTNLVAGSPSPQNFFVHTAFLRASIVRGGVNYSF
jgi:outer membrane immunogenic protein